MPLTKLSIFREQVYAEGSRPDIRTLRKHNTEGKIPGGTIDYNGRHWVDMDVYHGRVKVVNMDNTILRKIYGNTLD